MDENSKWDEHMLDAYLTYHGIFNDARLREKASGVLASSPRRASSQASTSGVQRMRPRNRHAVDMSEAEG